MNYIIKKWKNGWIRPKIHENKEGTFINQYNDEVIIAQMNIINYVFSLKLIMLIS